MNDKAKDIFALDHCNFVLKPEVFKNTLNVLNHFNCSKHSKIELKHGKWEAIYIFPKNGTLIELLKEDNERKKNRLDLYFRHVDLRKKVKHFLYNNYSDKNWISKKRYLENEIPWFESTALKDQCPYFYVSNIDFFKEGVKRRLLFGKDINNNINSVVTIKTNISRDIFDELEALIFYTGLKYKHLKNEKHFVFNQSHKLPLHYCFKTPLNKTQNKIEFTFNTGENKEPRVINERYVRIEKERAQIKLIIDN